MDSYSPLSPKGITHKEEFKAIAEALLQRHYGIDLNETSLCNDNVIEDCIKHGIRPYEAVNAEAKEAELDRVDIEGFYGVPTDKPIVAVEEYIVIAVLESEQEDRDSQSFKM